MKKALITGTSSGIGKATAIHLARNGYRVYATMRNLEKADDILTTASEEKLPLNVLELDVINKTSCEKAVSTILQNENKIDLLVNNAAISGSGSVEETPIDTYKEVFETNFFGTVRLIQLVVPHMRKRRSGSIINMSSVGGRIAIAPQSPYNSSKFALECLTETLAQEVRQYNIKVSLIEPGVVLTPIHKSVIDSVDDNSPYYEFQKRIVKIFRKEFQNALKPEDLARLILEVAESDNPRLRYILGKDAERWLEIRNSVSDEKWVTYGDHIPDEDFEEFYSYWFNKKQL